MAKIIIYTKSYNLGNINLGEINLGLESSPQIQQIKFHTSTASTANTVFFLWISIVVLIVSEIWNRT